MLFRSQQDEPEQNQKEEQEEPAQKEEAAPSGGNDLRARLNRLKNRG